MNVEYGQIRLAVSVKVCESDRDRIAPDALAWSYGKSPIAFSPQNGESPGSSVRAIVRNGDVDFSIAVKVGDRNAERCLAGVIGGGRLKRSIAISERHAYGIRV